jgi:protease-4
MRSLLPVVSACCLLLATQTGCIVIPIGDLLRGPQLQEQVLEEGAGFLFRDKIAVIEVDGVISSEEQTTFLTGGQENSVSELKARLDWAARDAEVRAVVLRISSPGGEVTACDVVHQEVKRFRERTGKPVVASIVDCGASGGYYIAAAADTILVHPTAIVGSIGVILHNFDLSGLLEKVGVAVNPVKSSEKKDLNSIFRKLSPDERQILQKLVDDMYQRFVDAVASGRSGLSREDVLKFADGRVVSGTEAVALKLADRVGYLSDAIQEAQTRAKVESPTVVRYTRRAQSGASVYTELAAPRPTADLQLTLSPLRAAGARLYYLWQPAL